MNDIIYLKFCITDDWKTLSSVKDFNFEWLHTDLEKFRQNISLAFKELTPFACVYLVQSIVLYGIYR